MFILSFQRPDSVRHFDTWILEHKNAAYCNKQTAETYKRGGDDIEM